MQLGDLITVEELMKTLSKYPDLNFRLERKEEVRLSLDVQDRFVSLY